MTMATHRIYLRWPAQRTTDKTTTESANVARFAFDELKAREDLQGKDVAIAWTCEGVQQAYHDFRGRLPSIDAARARVQRAAHSVPPDKPE